MFLYLLCGDYVAEHQIARISRVFDREDGVPVIAIAKEVGEYQVVTLIDGGREAADPEVVEAFLDSLEK